MYLQPGTPDSLNALFASLENGIYVCHVSRNGEVELNVIKQYRETGSIEPKQRLEQTPTKLNSAQLDILKNIVAANNDATLAELCDLLLQETNIRVGVSTMFRMLEKQDLTLKKKHFIRARKKLKKSKYNAVNSSQ
jgi:transposase